MLIRKIANVPLQLFNLGHLISFIAVRYAIDSFYDCLLFIGDEWFTNSLMNSLGLILFFSHFCYFLNRYINRTKKVFPDFFLISIFSKINCYLWNSHLGGLTAKRKDYSGNIQLVNVIKLGEISTTVYLNSFGNTKTKDVSFNV